MAQEIPAEICRGKKIIENPLHMNFWRACTDNDRGTGHEQRCGIWKDPKIRLLRFEWDPLSAQLYTAYSVNESFCQIKYHIYGNGKIEIEAALRPENGLPEIPQIGLRTIMDAHFTQVTWYGRGPFESYCDRKEAAKISLYRGSVKEQYTPYVRPQECGNKTDVKFARISGGEIGLCIRSTMGVEMSVLPYTWEEIDAAEHTCQLPPSNQCVLCINYQQMGVGGDKGWGNQAVAHPEYLCQSTRLYQYGFSIQGMVL